MRPIGDLLTGNALLTLPESATALDAARAMSARRVGAVLVLDDAGRLTGIFTERDLMLRVVVAGRAPAEVRLGEVMTRDLVTAAPDDRLNRVATQLQERHIRHIPIVRGGEVIGILSLRDLLREHVEIKRREVEQLTAYIQGEESAAG